MTDEFTPPLELVDLIKEAERLDRAIESIRVALHNAMLSGAKTHKPNAGIRQLKRDQVTKEKSLRDLKYSIFNALNPGAEVCLFSGIFYSIEDGEPFLFSLNGATLIFQRDIYVEPQPAINYSRGGYDFG